RLLRWSVTPAVAAALVPLAPLPVPVAPRDPLPAFITAGGWRQCVPEGGVLVPVPAATPPRPQPMRWPTATNVAFAIPEGFFIGPYGAGGTGAMGVSRFPVSVLLEQVADTGQVPPLGPAERDGMRAALAFWRADCVAVADSAPHAAALTAALADLMQRPGVRIADATAWKISR
ncbi:MAG TPA: hypothetical protein VFY17_08010, partial [Pilimelia sp.]|nr:hypothetical protein [Pilimelia sp.]